jgi:hypothetical protein
VILHASELRAQAGSKNVTSLAGVVFPPDLSVLLAVRACCSCSTFAKAARRESHSRRGCASPPVFTSLLKDGLQLSSLDGVFFPPALKQLSLVSVDPRPFIFFFLCASHRDQSAFTFQTYNELSDLEGAVFPPSLTHLFLVSGGCSCSDLGCPRAPADAARECRVTARSCTAPTRPLQDANSISDLEGVELPSGLTHLSLVSRAHHAAHPRPSVSDRAVILRRRLWI